MCLGVPGKIIEIYEQDGLRMGRIDFDGARRAACLTYVPEAVVGDYTLIHVGFALSVLSEAEAQASLAALREMADLEAELGPETPTPLPAARATP
ncbi:MAG: HypC/HybG/HupF family hydrogenase formation chaperone [Anaerolineales bacterium]|nr:HypC/HybG/HupF family hydrogenase formation chaperone [Anaerolineales bacterium]